MLENPIQKMLRYRWYIFITLSMAYLFVYFHRLSLSVVADRLIHDFQSTASVIGILGSLYFYCYAVMQLPAGLLSDSIGPRKTVSLFLFIAAMGSIIFGISKNIQIAFAGRILVGFGVSMVFIPTMKIFSQWFRKHEFAQMAGILNAVGGAGVLAATWLLALMTDIFGWRLSFILIGGITFSISILSWIIVRDRPQDKKWPSISEIDGNMNGAQSSTAGISLMEGVRKVVSEKHFWPLAVWFFFNCGIFFGFGGLWSGPYLMDVYGISRTEAGSVLSMIAWGMIIGSPLLGLLSDRLLKSRKKPFILSTATLTILLFVLYIFPTGLSKASIYIFFFIFSISSSAIVIVGFTSTKELFPLEIAGTSVGTVNLFPFLGGAVFMPFLGKILDAYRITGAHGYSLEGYSMLILILLISSIIALACTFMMKETFGK
jgi:sugar phosphate permease